MDFFKFFQKESAKPQSPEILNEQIRLVAYQNSASILFDTLSIDNIKNKNGGVQPQQPQPQQQQQQTPNKTMANGKGSQSPVKPRGKVEMLKEMMFGTVPMNFQGTTTKIHYLPENNQMLLTKLFTLNLQREETKPPTSPQSSSSSTNNNNTTNTGRPLTTIITPPSPASAAPLEEMKKSASSATLQDLSKQVEHAQAADPSCSSAKDSNSNSNSSTLTKDDTVADLKSNVPNVVKPTLTTSGGNLPTSSTSSPNKTTTTTTNTTTTNNLSSSTNNASTMRSRSSSTMGARVMPKSPLQSQPQIKKVTLALCIIFGPRNDSLTPVSEAVDNPISRFHQFIMTHFVYIDMRIKPIIKLLKNQIYSKFTQMKPSNHGSLSGFGLTEVNQIYREVEKFRQYIKDLYYAPRLEKPLWIDSLSHPSTKRQYFITFLDNLRDLLPLYNTPKTKFFLTTMISSILTYNLTWLANMLASCTNSTAYRCTADRCNTLYNYENQFINQMAEMVGYTGCLSPQCRNVKAQQRLSKLVLIAPKEDVAKKFLQVISYFWRSFELVINKNNINNLSNMYSGDDLGKPFIFDQSSNNNNNNNSNTAEHQQQGTPSSSSVPMGSSFNNNNQTFNNHNSHTPMKYSTMPPIYQHGNGTPSKSTPTSPPPSIPLPTTNFNIGSYDSTVPSFIHNLPRSMLGGYSTKYVSDQSILAVPKNDFFPQLVDDLRLWIDYHPFPSPVREFTAIIADTTKSSCELVVVSKENLWSDTNPITVNQTSYPDVKILKANFSEYVSSILNTIVHFWTIGMPPESCIIYLEDKLRELFVKTLRYHETLKHYITLNQPIPSTINLLPTGVNLNIPTIQSTLLATPLASPHASVTNFDAIKQSLSGDQILLESIYTYLVNCQKPEEPSTKSSPTTTND
ncbi:hypothetical protein DFA_04001 [Cavenderia fasciculata]|uniref:UDENN FNIP1/2-type domain-containing protein n=1 Tax=Cavenderia fasciculata TaxID=261658 RepID=F4Q106_CACFS|nr:uncharacterized protein DFA_04001 [Cavenderia fasciculata]EGG18507.1 hypothetical protein DFA_04001 [Cavenderia fasciculata]|eukprot:XP_004366411.1 hypothetical protein DFA_04001 [Cavenderia fasciculata]